MCMRLLRCHAVLANAVILGGTPRPVGTGVARRSCGCHFSHAAIPPCIRSLKIGSVRCVEDIVEGVQDGKSLLLIGVSEVMRILTWPNLSMAKT
jgi:hypothetical protein